MHRTAIALLVCLAGAATACKGGGDAGSTPDGQTLSPGERPTSSATASFRSMRDECNVTIATANANQVAGSFICTWWKSADGSATVETSGRFSASG